MENAKDQDLLVINPVEDQMFRKSWDRSTPNIANLFCLEFAERTGPRIFCEFKQGIGYRAFPRRIAWDRIDADTSLPGPVCRQRQRRLQPDCISSLLLVLTENPQESFFANISNGKLNLWSLCSRN